jgi:hypothetical protein
MHKTLTWLVPLVALLAYCLPQQACSCPAAMAHSHSPACAGMKSRCSGAGCTSTIPCWLAQPCAAPTPSPCSSACPCWYSFTGIPARQSECPLALLGVLFYFLYKGASLTFSAAFNPLFLVYTALFSSQFVCGHRRHDDLSTSKPWQSASSPVSRIAARRFSCSCRVWHPVDLVERSHPAHCLQAARRKSWDLYHPVHARFRFGGHHPGGSHCGRLPVAAQTARLLAGAPILILCTLIGGCGHRSDRCPDAGRAGLSAANLHRHDWHLDCDGRVRHWTDRFLHSRFRNLCFSLG